MAGEKIVKMMQQGKLPPSDLADLVFGQVVSVNPLEIKLDTHIQALPESFFLLSPHVREFRPEGRLLWRGLRTGDKVTMIRLSKGQKYYVLEREGELHDT